MKNEAEKSELDLVKERMLELAAKREKRLADAAAADELPKAKQALADAEALDRAESDVGLTGKEIMVLDTEYGSVIVKRATSPSFKFFTSESIKPKANMHELADKLVKPCLVHPSKEAFDTMVSKQPHILTRAANAISHLAGVRDEEVVGK